MKIRVLVILSIIAILAAVAWGGRRIANLATLDSPPEIPTTPVKKGPVTIVVAARGELHFYGKAGSAILFNAATLHGLTRAATERERRILQIYYGHEGRKPLAEVTLMPPRLWRDHPDPETRRPYGLNQYTRDMQRWLCAGE